jgi:5'-nucleotidase
MFILCTNDDGYLAPGIALLSTAARTLGEVHVVAPDREQSATSHSLTMHHPLRARTMREGVHTVDGTPTDCVALAVGALLDRRPDLVLSGVNHGPNMGEDVLYSGTVAGAMEAAILGIPAIAISYAGRDSEHLAAYGPLLETLLPQLIGRGDAPNDTLFNVNLPPLPPSEVKGVRITVLGRRTFTGSVMQGRDPFGRPFYWLGGGVMEWSGSEETDFHAVENGYISVTPLHLDLTNHRLVEHVKDWGVAL